MKKIVILFVVLVVAFAFTFPAAAAAQNLTEDEEAGLLYMFEEEKLARDGYNALYARWGQAAFQNIAIAEQIHMDAVRSLLVRYGVPVPADVVGVFADPSLQALYDDQMEIGSQSLADALKVGATIEELDIVDLQSRLELTTKFDIKRVYTNLMKASYNHLRNFVKVLYRLTGEVYEPQYLDADLYESIVTGVNGNGNKQSNASNAGSATAAGTGNGDLTRDRDRICDGDCTCDGTGSSTGNTNRSGKP